MTDKIEDLVALLRDVALSRVEEARARGHKLTAREMCEWKAARALEAQQAELGNLKHDIERSMSAHAEAEAEIERLTMKMKTALGNLDDPLGGQHVADARRASEALREGLGL